jgi:hypothetical protein
MLTADSLGILVAKRVKLGPEYRLSLQTLIPAGLANLAKNVARDPSRRNMLLTDPLSVSANITQSVINGKYIADLSTVLTTNQAMLETLRYGTIWHVPASVSFSAGDVNTTTNEIEVNIADIQTGDRIRFTTTGTLPDNIVVNTIYFAIRRDATTLAVAATLADALTDTGIGFSFQPGTGNSLIHYVDGWREVEWVMSPPQGTLEQCGPFPYITVYLVGDQMYVNEATGGVLRFAVPFLPTLATFPADEDLEQDLLDEIVAIYLTGDPKIEKDG